MSIELTKPEERLNETANPAEKSAPTLEPSQPTATNAQPRPRGGKKSTGQPVSDPSDLLARLQDILAKWPGSDNRFIDGYLMAVFPIPDDLTIDRVMTTNEGGTGQVFRVNGVPVVGVGHDNPGHDKKAES